MHINKINIKNFRCFKDLEITFDAPISIISGDNGAGKTSILEAMHYLCYMKSFRTASPKELINFDLDGENFFVKANFMTQSDQEQENELQIGFSHSKRLVKLNKKSVSSFKDIMDFYRIVTLTEDDLLFIKGGPEIRRDFLDHAILLLDHTFLGKIKEFKKILQNRNILLQNGNFNRDLYDLWTEQLWEKSIIIQKLRRDIIKEYESLVNNILKDIFSRENIEKGDQARDQLIGAQLVGAEQVGGQIPDEISISLEYKTKKVDLEGSFDDFIAKNSDLMTQEVCFKRSLFGAHLDDFIIKFQCKKSKNYASRGQQKLVVLMLKVAQLVNLEKKRGLAVFLLDDFMTDFDEKRAEIIIKFLVSLKVQLIFTSPASGGFFEDLLVRMGASKIKLTA